ncbi:uncharacterized protein F4822DRAFT_396316 [Hypoxylon trugodes]|uniref:uncharacterized protein n=1 Tax=Hypoxylon trugodes TaxID=326681 RepID=UPI00218FB69F|nr:uncharacterized protein F4822DRAFT_396316 [Hypoxylon trugodes]KAI1391313.1 hypothetical protein F4822DRAFT_396316 [Hypoxylon trugodes]
MRMVRIGLRDVKPNFFVLHRISHAPHRQLYQREIRLSTQRYKNDGQRYISAASLHELGATFNKISSGIPRDLEATQALTTPQQRSGSLLIQDTELFEKWRALLTNPLRLAVESDFDRRGPAKAWPRRLLVDNFENRSDLTLWTCLLDYQKRINGDAGVRSVWNGLWGRKSLYEVQDPLAPVFWQTILDAAVKSNDRKFLTSVWVYSEWMYDRHGVKWPQLYSTVLTHFLRTHQHQQVLQWQLRLTPNFYPGVEDFTNMIKHFANDHALYRTPTLESLYIVNPDRRLYDAIVPYLYDLGEFHLARKWRRLCIRHDDTPLAPIHARSFLRLLQGYFPHEQLHPDESVAVHDVNFETPENTERIELSREFVNRVHGGTFGIKVKQYNDKLGAKWLASSWVSLNIAISTISALGIEEIGPLSLQSIALREGTSDGVLDRIEQLKEHGISVADSNYYRLVAYLARVKDDELLLDLLRSDLHPDVFDDSELQARLIVSAAQSEDWRTYRLILVTKLVVMEKPVRGAANALARVYIQQKDRQRLSKLLDDMRSMGITIDCDQTHLIFDSFVNEAKSTFISSDSLNFYLPICRQLLSMEIPVPVRCWRKFLFCLARQERTDELEKICVELVDMFASSKSSRPGFVPVHPEDIPEPMRKPLSGVKNLLGVYIPQDLPTQTPQHPLRQIFDSKLLGTIVRCSFHSSINDQSKSIHTLQLSRRQLGDFNGGRAIRLLRMLRDRGLFLDPEHLATWVKLRLVTLYGPGYPTKRNLQVVRASNTLTLSQMKSLLDEAWGEEFLPPIEKLRAEIYARGHKAMAKDKKYLRSMGRTAPQLRMVI